MRILETIISIFEFLDEFNHQIFQKLYLITGIKKKAKVVFQYLKEGSYYAQNHGSFFGSNSTSNYWLGRMLIEQRALIKGKH